MSRRRSLRAHRLPESHRREYFPRRRHRLIGLPLNEIPVVEDNYYGDVHFDGDKPPALYALVMIRTTFTFARCQNLRAWREARLHLGQASLLNKS